MIDTSIRKFVIKRWINRLAGKRIKQYVLCRKKNLAFEIYKGLTGIVSFDSKGFAWCDYVSRSLRNCVCTIYEKICRFSSPRASWSLLSRLIRRFHLDWRRTNVQEPVAQLHQRFLRFMSIVDCPKISTKYLGRYT